MRNEDGGEADLVVKLAHRAPEHVARDRIERAERLVQQQQFALARQRARDADALLLAAGKLRGQAIGEIGRQTDAFERGADVDRSAAGKPGDDADILGHGQMREQADILEDIADAAAKLDRIDMRDVLSVDQDPPRVGTSSGWRGGARWTCPIRTDRPGR